jgi:hypothetical protein
MSDNNLLQLIQDLPPELVREVEDFILFILERHSKQPQMAQFEFKWENGLSSINESCTSMNIQTWAYQQWEDINVSH